MKREVDESWQMTRAQAKRLLGIYDKPSAVSGVEIRATKSGSKWLASVWILGRLAGYVGRSGLVKKQDRAVEWPTCDLARRAAVGHGIDQW